MALAERERASSVQRGRKITIIARHVLSCDNFCFLKPNPLEPPCWKCSELIIKIWSLDKEWVEHWETEMRRGKNDDHASRAYRWWNSSMTSSILLKWQPPFIIFYYPHCESSRRDGDHLLCYTTTLCHCCPLLIQSQTSSPSQPFSPLLAATLSAFHFICTFCKLPPIKVWHWLCQWLPANILIQLTHIYWLSEVVHMHSKLY